MGKVLGLLVLMLGLAAGTARAAELVMFDDPTCVWCRRWLAEIGPGYPHTDEGKRAPLRRVNINRQDRVGVVLRTAVTATPTFVLVEDGREVGRITGYPGADYFYPALDELLQKLPAAAPRRPELQEMRAEGVDAR